MIQILVFLAACSVQDLEYPLFEKDPWAGFLPGSVVVRETNIANRIRTETTITLKSIEIGSKTLSVLRQGEEEEQTLEFVPFSAALLADGSGNKLSGKSNRVVPFGAAKVKALVREISPEGETGGNGTWKLTTADETPGGIVEAGWSYEDEKTKAGVSCAFKALEKLKIQGKELSCARFDVKETQTLKSKRILEGSYWLSSQVPGLLVKSVTRVTEGKDVTETTVQTIKFEAKK
jgi:hypothetical protein